MRPIKLRFGYLVLVALLVLPHWGLSASAEIVVVVSADSPVEQLSKGQLINIFLGRSNYFSDGLEALPIDQSEGSEAREEFYQSLLSWPPAKLKAHWSKVIFTGRGKPPKQVKSDEDVRAIVSNNLNAIGYIDKASINEHVKVLDISP